LIHFEDPNHKNPLLWKALREASAVIACSNYEREGMMGMGINPSKIHLIPMGINLEEWKNPDGDRFRRKYRLKGKKIILFAGTKDYNKGAIHLLQAVEKIRQKVKDVILVSIGLPTREWQKKRSLFHEDDLLDLCYISEEEKREAFDACDLFVMPSRYDSFGIVYLEAWRCGKPVIGARVGAIPEVIEEGKDGLLVEFGEVDQLASAIISLLNNPDLCKEMGETGRKKVIDRFNWQKNIGKIEEVFKGAKVEWR
jgi:glycosyltransferase involved in cell wall biosynthesis